MANLEELNLGARRYRPRKSALLHKLDPAEVGSQACYDAGYYFRSGGNVRASTINFLGRPLTRRAHTRRATCAEYPKQNGWVDLISEVSRQTGLSAAESAAVLKESGYQKGTLELSKSPEYRRQYNDARKRVKSPRAAPQVDVQAAVSRGQQYAAAKGGAPAPRLSPRRARSLGAQFV